MASADSAHGEKESPIIGADGIEYISTTLSALHPQVAIKQIQTKCMMQQPMCTPLMGMVDQLGISRADAHRGVLQAAKQVLMAKISGSGGTKELDKVCMERLLNASFAFLGMQELRDVPLAVMDKLEKVPPVFLKQLTADKQIFKDLPAKVQRQVWEFDKNLLQQDALSPVGQYKYETATIMRALAMDEFLPAVTHAHESAGVSHPQTGAGRGRVAKRPSLSSPELAEPDSTYALPGSGGITRKILRKGSRVLQILKGMVGSSTKIFNQVVELCVVKYRDSEGLYCGFPDLSYCTLRCQLLMALHDDNNAVSSRDRCHELAWTLDAGIMNGRLSDKHLAKLEKFFADVDAVERYNSASVSAHLSKSSKKKHGQPPEAESAGDALGSTLSEPYKVLGDVGIILRDPSTMHLLSANALQIVVQGATESGALPRDSNTLRFILRMMQLAVDSRQMLRDRKYRFPDADRRVEADVLPLLGALALEFKIVGSPPPSELKDEVECSEDLEEAFLVASHVLPKSEVARKLVQVFVLERLGCMDFLSAGRCLRLLASTLSPKCVAAEAFDFAAALALRLSDLVKTRRLHPTSALWRYAVDNLLVRAVDSHTQVHEEVLRLLLAASSQLAPTELGTYLQLTLDHSKRSRKRSSKKLQALQQHGSLDPLSDIPFGMASDLGSDGWPGILPLKHRSADGVRSIYALFKNTPGMNMDTAPHLFAYLDEETAAKATDAAQTTAEMGHSQAAGADTVHRADTGNGEEHGGYDAAVAMEQ